MVIRGRDSQTHWFQSDCSALTLLFTVVVWYPRYGLGQSKNIIIIMLAHLLHATMLFLLPRVENMVCGESEWVIGEPHSYGVVERRVGIMSCSERPLLIAQGDTFENGRYIYTCIILVFLPIS